MESITLLNSTKLKKTHKEKTSGTSRSGRKDESEYQINWTSLGQKPMQDSLVGPALNRITMQLDVSTLWSKQKCKCKLTTIVGRESLNSMEYGKKINIKDSGTEWWNRKYPPHNARAKKEVQKYRRIFKLFNFSFINFFSVPLKSPNFNMCLSLH